MSEMWTLQCPSKLNLQMTHRLCMISTLNSLSMHLRVTAGHIRTSFADYARCQRNSRSSLCNLPRLVKSDLLLLTL